MTQLVRQVKGTLNNKASSRSILVYDFEISLKGSGLYIPFLIYDLPGKEVFRTPLAGPLSEIQRGNLADGIYLYKVYNKNQLIGKGKIAIK